MADKLAIQVLNNVSVGGLARLPPERYTVGPGVAEPAAILLRSADLHGVGIPASVRVPATRGLVGAANIALLRAGSVLLNFSRDGVADNAAVREALDAGVLGAPAVLAALAAIPGVLVVRNLPDTR
jgi:D-3-phosphoglycerate dehydrogenase